MIPIRNLGTPFEYKASERLVQLLFMPYRITAKDTTTDKDMVGLVVLGFTKKGIVGMGRVNKSGETKSS